MDEDAVSEVVGFILIAVIVMVALTWLAAVALPLITEVQENTGFARGQSDLAKLQREMETVARGPIGGQGSSRQMVFSLGEGSLTVDNGSGSVQVDFATEHAALTGNVTSGNGTGNVSGEPVAGVDVSLAGTGHSTSTSADGSYSMWVPTGDTYLVRASRAGFEDQERSVDFTGTESVDFELNVTNGTLVTRVENSSGSYLSGVSVTINGTPYSYEATADGDDYFVETNTTDANGYANFTGVPTGKNFTVTFEEDWYVDEERRSVRIRNDSTTRLNVTVEPAGRARARVLNRTGGALGGASVSVYNLSRDVVRTNTTDGTGNATFYGLPTGSYSAVALAPDRAPNSTSVTASFETQSNETLRLDNATTHTLEGRVTDSINSSFGVPDAWVNYTYNSTNVPVGTNESGGYDVPVVNGTRAFTADAEDYLPSNETLNVTGDRTRNFSLTLDSVDFFHGYVKNSTGSVIDDATVTVRGETDAGWSFRGTDDTGTGGHYNVTDVVTDVVTGLITVGGVPPGNHSIEVSKPGYVTRDLRFELNDTHNKLNVTLNETGDVTVNGTVKDVLGSPVEGANVTAVGTTYSDTTDANGFYSITLPADTYNLKASKDGYLPSYSRDTPIEADETVNFTLTVALTPGHVRYEYANQQVWLENDLLARGEGERSAYVRSNFFRVINNTDGTYTLSMHVLTVEEGNTTIGGGTTRITTRFLDFSEVYSRQTGNITFTIESRVHNAWSSFLRDSLQDQGLKEGTGFTVQGPTETGESGTVRVSVEGATTGSNDLHLRVHETKLQVEAQ